ncbi:NAD(P)/FAD-dependent oxidoreductase [Nitrospira sp. NS4]|uniref:NAD(P)/FAD-dependent oxidoreductase n=1 Tax=Nitrospira sp. NS4 TaxID=3414498 RepID=UPI003C2D95E0
MSNLESCPGCDVAIIGAGAAGLAAAIFAGEAVEQSGPSRIVVLDGAKTIGAKILVSGGGRCNVTHDEVSPTDFFGNRRIIKNVLAAFSVEETISWFASMGVNLKREETGKLFPVTDKARTVLNALVDRCRKVGVTICPDHRVQRIEQVTGTEAGFRVHHTHGTLVAKKLILATGGRSIPKSGSDGFGYELARRLGHQVTVTVPALVPLVLVDTMFHKTLSGLSQEVELTTIVNGRTIDIRTGSLLWTHFGISGPVVMDASRFWCLARKQGESAEVYANFLPGETQEQLRQWFMEQTREHPRRSLGKTLAQRLPQRFADAVIRHAGCDGQTASAQLPRKDRDHLLALLTKFPFPVVQDRGWNYAEVTAGGVPLEEINFRTMESKLAPGLYLVGEILDCDGRIGGFNFQWAWVTGRLAGRASAVRGRRGDGSTGD